MTMRSLYFTLLLFAATGLVFAIWPQLDIATSALFHSKDGFLGRSAAARSMRFALHYLPAAIAIVVLAAWLAHRIAPTVWLARFAPATRGLAFAGLSLALGPGMLVNAGLKDYWGRPRPVHIQQFGGASAYYPWWRAGGPCGKNCSFVSGEVAGSFWLAAPASLAPPPVRTLAIAGAIAAGSLTALGRVASGAHFLSDVIFAALLTLLVCQILYLIIFGRGPPDA